MKFILMSLFALLFSNSALAHSQCPAVSPELSEQARVFMAQNGLVIEGEETEIPEIQLAMRWTLRKVLPTESGGCALQLQLCGIDTGTKIVTCDETAPHEMVALDTNGRLALFEDVVAVPSSLIAKIGSNREFYQQDPSYYYVRLSGQDAISAVKSKMFDVWYFGFIGVVERGSKASFDPTPNRDWQVIEGHYNLRRGNTTEVMDIQAYQLDGLDGDNADVYWRGCVHSGGNPKRCDVGPWGQAYLLEILSR